MEALPENLIEEVLIKLPCKSLIRFKRASTVWHNLISRQSFAISKVQSFKDLNALFFLYDTNPRPSDDIIITPVCVSRAAPTHQFVISVNPHMKLELLPPAMDSLKMLHLGLGIYCVFDLTTFTEFLWNPTTGQTQLLPKSPYSKFSVRHSHHFGRVYFEEDGQFHYQVGRFNVHTNYALDLYSSKTGSWSYTGQVFCDCNFVGPSQCGINLDGKAHFLIGGCYANAGDKYIASFDYETGMFGRIRIPFAARAGPYLTTYGILTLYDEKFICLILARHMNRNDRSLDIWVMRDYHDEDSWVKQFTVGPLPSPRCMIVMGFSSKLQGFLVLQSYNRLALCDCKSSAVTECDSIINFSRGKPHVVEQVESLVSMS